MANKKKAAGATKAPSRKAAVKDKDVQSAKTARQVAEEQKDVDENLAAQAMAEAEALVRMREKFNAGLRQNVMGQHLISMTEEEKLEVLGFLARLRGDAAKKRSAGGAPKRYLVVEAEGPVRVGGVTYNVPVGRHEITDEFLAEYFPAGTTADALAGGLYVGRFKVEQEDAAPPKQAKPVKGTRKVSVGHGRQPANDFSQYAHSTHPEATHLAEADRKNFLAGNGTR